MGNSIPAVMCLLVCWGKLGAVVQVAPSFLYELILLQLLPLQTNLLEADLPAEASLISLLSTDCLGESRKHLASTLAR
ncbi:hypothetical protein Y032_0074g855 [Ancylostoma ceylanicum]|uniref:Uncharacterized protein n=1 Tax=Ancylostoma ceylanicum TaxID=53326 RepID=A0A016TVQ9_9BILA|nr:hypothetical protein Y032_0074g855 [Ancylostoma ceylanicum]